jgi:hypothetical protein
VSEGGASTKEDGGKALRMSIFNADNPELRTYGAAMDRGQPFIRLRLDVHEPIELGDFVTAFTAMAAEYDRYVRDRRPEDSPEATLYVKQVRSGSIEADLIPWLFSGLLSAAEHANTLGEFVERYGGRIGEYLKPGGRAVGATQSELKDFSSQVAAIANTAGSSLEVAALEIENGAEKVRAVFKFNTAQAREIQERVGEHRHELEHASGVEHTRALMVFTRSDVGKPAVGKSTGERVRIEAISTRSLPLIYASELAERQIKHEITEAEDNVYKKGFVVDVNVEMRNGKPAAYRVTNVHQVIELDDD